MRLLFNSLAACLMTGAVAQADVVIQTQSSTTSLAYAGDASSTDLINAGQPSLASSSVTTSDPNFPGTGINDGVCSNTFAANTFFQSGVQFPATATYQLNLAASPNGYDIQSIASFMGWDTYSQLQANQDYTVEVSVVGAEGFRPVANVKYTPFPGATSGYYESKVTITENTTGVLARNVSAVRFLFADPGNLTANAGTVVREIDVNGIPSATAPSPVSVQAVTDFSAIDNAYAGDVASDDLVNAGQPTLAAFTSSTTPEFGAGGQNDGTSSLSNLAACSWYKPSQLPATLTFDLNTSAYPDGYVISAIRTFAGGKEGGTQCYANQKYTVEYLNAGSSTWLPLTTVDFSPFSSQVNTPASTRVKLSAPTGNLLSGVASLRFTLQVPTRAYGTNNGTVLQEIDVIGYPVGSTPVSAVGISTPVGPYIVQRNSTNTGTIPITGTYTATPDRIEARAVVMDGINSGTTTNWQTIASTLAGGSFAGSLSDVPAGGWYRLEVRSVSGDTPSTAKAVDNIGVGDIFITAGQSNSASFGGPPMNPTNSHVMALSALSDGTWVPANDPQPIADGTGGSVWSRLGDLYAASQNVPIGFVSVGIGGTASSQWLPSSNVYYPRLQSAVQLFGTHGFKAVLWHQGEADSIANSTAAIYQANLQTIIAQSRADAGWAVPWYVAEASYTPSTNLGQELQVNAGQRATAYADPLVKLGPRTDDFHLEGKVLSSDGIHFNADGLADHAQQWLEILTGSQSLQVINGDFEANTALTDGGIATADISATWSPSVIGFQILAAGGITAADGSNGYWNPDATFYTNLVDSVNDGVAANMSGKHVAYLYGGSAGNHFLQTLRTVVLPNTDYTLRVALGRRNAAGFGGAKIELLADGVPLGSGLTVQEADLAPDAFTDVSLTCHIDDTQAAGAQLAIRITKLAGADTYLDFDNVRLTSTSSAFGQWQESHFGSTANPLAGRMEDPDGDSLANIFEFILGTPPDSFTPPPAPIPTGSGFRYEIPLNPDANEPGFDIEYSLDLITWYSASSPAHAEITSQRTSVSWTVYALGLGQVFFRMIVPNGSDNVTSP